MVIIIGSGPAGLSCSAHLKDSGIDSIIFEKESRAGGLLKTKIIGNYQFDYGGHLLHFRDPKIEKLVKNVVGKKNFIKIKRKAFIYSNRVLTPYPFQVNTYGLPNHIIQDCLLGFIKAHLNKKRSPRNFKEWILAHFGQGFAKHFFFPFNQKFWKIRLEKLDSEWAEWSIPKPSLKNVMEGALGLNKEDFGYNIWFYYPKTGGIETVARRMAGKAGKIFLNREIIAVHLKDRKILLANGEKWQYNRLVSTMPLKELIKLIKDAPAEIKRAGNELKYLSVFCVNLGIKGPKITPAHWIYFPEKRFIFYRAGFYSNFFEKSNNYQSMVLEITHLPEEKIKENLLIKRAISDFKKTGFLRNKHQIEHSGYMRIPYAYVLYDKARSRVLDKILNFLEKNQIYSIGRYGRWGYSTIEDALREGGEGAKKIARCQSQNQ